MSSTNLKVSNRTTPILAYIAVGIIALNTYFATVPEIPRYVIIAFGAMSVLAMIAREQLKTSLSSVALQADPSGGPPS